MTQTLSGAIGEMPMTPTEVAAQIQVHLQEPCVPAFHALWYQAKHTWPMTRYKGVPILKCPMDLQVYHELLWQLKPALIIETGTCFGGSALWFADQLDMAGRGRVISIDLHDKKNPDVCVNDGNRWPRVHHERIEWIVGNSLDAETVARCEQAADLADGPVLVSLDSDHREAHVLAELEAYAPLVTDGSHCVVEDTNMSGRPMVCDDPGPGAAVETYLAAHDGWIQNALCERYLLTMHPRGWLCRVG